jgi:hypothetical protein
MKKTLTINVTIDSESAYVEAFNAFKEDTGVLEIVRNGDRKISINDAAEQFKQLLSLLLD